MNLLYVVFLILSFVGLSAFLVYRERLSNWQKWGQAFAAIIVIILLFWCVPLAGVGRLISLAGEIQKQFSDIVVVGTGYSWLRTLMPNVAAASTANGLASIIGVGRMAFAYPDFAKDIILKGRLDPKKVCIACSKCSQIMIDGGMIGCVVRDRGIYSPIYQKGRAGADKKD